MPTRPRRFDEETFRSVVEACPDGMILFGEEGDILFANAEIEAQFGYSREEILGRPAVSLLAERPEAPRYPMDLRSVARGVRVRAELVGLRKDGSEFPIEVGMRPIRQDERTVILAVVTDVTERCRAERLKGEFVATVSHELRTPLTSIAGSLGLLTARWAEAMPGPAARLAAIAQQNCGRLVRLVNDILDIEKLEAGRVVFSLAKLELAPLIEQAIDGSRGYAEPRGVRLRFEDADVEPVNADADRLGQVMTNLLSNAIKFSPKEADVVVSLEARDETVRISVRDHGSGIPVAFRERLFEKFAQADASDARERGGTGLGLSIAKEIVERLGGRLGFADAQGGGTVFHVDLPAWRLAREHEVEDALGKAEASIEQLLETVRDHVQSLPGRGRMAR